MQEQPGVSRESQKDTILSWAKDHKFKIVLVGDSGVGKTSIFWQYIEEIFPDDIAELKVTMVDFKIKNVIIDNELIKLYIWDTAGQERYRALVSNYFKGTQGILLIFDLGNPASFESIQNSWYQIGKEKSGDASFILVGNKSDLKVRKVDPVKIEQFSKAHNLPYFEVSAFTGSNINEAFNCIATDIKVRVIKKDPTKSEEDSQINERENTQVTKIDAKKQSIILKSSPKQTDPKQKKKDCSC